MTLKRILYIPILFILFSLQLQAQDKLFQLGSPFLQNYTPLEYGGSAQIWDAKEDARGIMYFGDNNGLLEFDGVNWNIYPVSNASVVRSLNIHSSGKIFVGAINEFGFFEPDSIGKLAYTSLSEQLPDSLSTFHNVWKTFSNDDAIFFITKNIIFKWDGTKLEHQTVDLVSLFAFQINDEILVLDSKKGLCHVHDNQLKQLPNTMELTIKNSGYFLAVPLSDTKILLALNSIGFFTYDLKEEVLERVLENSFAEKYAKENMTYMPISLQSGKIAFATIRGGILILDKNLEVERIITKHHGLASNTIYSIYQDSNNNLWTGTQLGISRIDISNPVVHYNESIGLNDFVLDFQHAQGNTYISTTNRLYYIDKNTSVQTPAQKQVQILDGITDCWDLFSFQGKLLAGTGRGIYEIDDKKATQILPTTRSFSSATNESAFPNFFFLGQGDGMLIVKAENTTNGIKIIEKQKVVGVKEQIRSLVFDEGNQLWASTYNKGLIRLSFANKNPFEYSIEKFNFEHGLPKDIHETMLTSINKKVKILTHSGIYTINESTVDSTKLFLHDSEWNALINRDSTSVSSLVPIDKNSVFVYGKKKGIYNLQQQDTAINEKPFVRIEGAYNIECTNKQYLTYGSATGMYVYKIDNNKNFNKPYPVLIRKVSLHNDSILFAGTFTTKDGSISSSQTTNATPTLSYAHNSIRLEYSALFFEETKYTQYQYKMDGFEEKWSSWTQEEKANYTNLPEGKYTFMVRAKNAYGLPSTVSTYSFRILAPWYRTTLAYIAYIALLVLLFYIGIKWNTRRLKQQNLQLEAMVVERTEKLQNANNILTIQKQELKEKQEEILVQNEEILQANEEIMAQRDSIASKNLELKKLSIVASQTNNSVLITSPTGEIEWVNKSFGKMSGFTYEAYKEKYGNNAFSLLAGEEGPEAILQEIYDKSVSTRVISFNNSKGETIWVQTTISAVYDDFGELSQLVAINSNITQVKLAELQIKVKNELINSSINYASTIQRALLPSLANINEYFSAFVLFRPKDVVSGDFYWHAQVGSDHFFAVVDCTGHGVPGAFMSMIGNRILNELIIEKKISSPREVLEQMDKKITRALRQKETSNKDGMDLGILRLSPDSTDNKVCFAGAKNDLYVVGDHVEIIKGTRRSIGGSKNKKKVVFEDIEVTLQASSQLFLTTDGYIDQNDDQRKRFGSQRFTALLQQIKTLPQEQQKLELEKALNAWQGQQKQRDDIAVLALHL